MTWRLLFVIAIFLTSSGELPGAESVPSDDVTATVQAGRLPTTAGINVLDHGAVADGKADDTAALQSAIDAAAKGGQVNLGPGTYKVSSQIKLRSGLRLVGFGRPTIITGKTVQGGVVLIEADAQGITIDGIRIEANISHAALKNDGSASRIAIKNCDFVGSLPHTNFLIDFDGEMSDVTIDECSFSRTLNGIRLRDRISRATVSGCVFSEWKTYGIVVRSGDAAGPKNVTLSSNRFHSPVEGRGGARQMIVSYGDQKTPATNISGLQVLDNYCIGPGEPWDADSETSRGTADQIVLHYTRDFLVRGNTSLNGGENGISVTRFCTHGIVSNNISSGHDGHGIQVSSLADRSTDILITGNLCVNNGARLDGKGDVMAGIYVQDGERIGIHANQIVDNRNPRKQKYGLLIAASENVDLGSNTIHFVDSAGAEGTSIFSSTLTKPLPGTIGRPRD